MRYLLTIILAGMILKVDAQKKLVPVSSSFLSGIPLPAGSKQDNRGLSNAAARILLEEESKKSGAGIRETEVFLLPSLKEGGYTVDSFYRALTNAGWVIYPLKSDSKYLWLQKENVFLLAFFSSDATSTNLYLGKATASSAIQTVVSDNPVMKVNVGSNTREEFTFFTTNWDDGWVSTIAEDKVVVQKKSARVFLYFPVPYTDEARSAGRDYFWDTFISRQFQIISKQYRDNGEVMAAFQPPYIEASAIDPKSGVQCFLALYVASDAGYMYPTLAVTPDESTLRNLFPKATDKYTSDLNAMRNYNKFAIGKNDLTGDWAGSTSAAMNYYNAYTGNYIGINAAASSEEFHFNADGTYSSLHKGASGMVGSMQTYQQKYEGNLSVSNWEIDLSNRANGVVKAYDAYFEAVKGGRILHLQDKQASAMWYHLVKK